MTTTNPLIEWVHKNAHRGRWTLDEFTRGGDSYLVARCSGAKPAPSLFTAREAEVLAHAAQGETNKVIAYELGIAASTVRVLLHRAAGKLGVRGRAHAIRQFEALKLTTP